MPRLRERLDAALVELETEGRLTSEQRAQVAERLHQVLRAGGLDPVSVVATLGGLCVAAGILYLIAYNWEQLGKATKLGLVFGLWGAVHGAGWYLAEGRGTHPKVGRALTLAGVLCLGGALGLVGQIYHLAPTYPTALFWWWAASVPVVLVTRSPAIAATVLAIALTWVPWHLGVWYGQRPESVSALELLAGFPLVGLGLSGLLASLAVLCAGTRLSSLTAVLAAPVIPLAAAAPFVLAFHEPWIDAPRAELPFDHPAPVILALALSVAAVFAVHWRRGAAAARELWALPAVLVGFALAATTVPRAVPLLGNLALFGGALALTRLGAAQGRQGLAQSGVALLVAGLLARYFEYLWDKLEGAYAFLVTGAVLLGAALLFENRRRAVAARLGERAP